MTDEAKKKLIWKWDPEEERIYTKRQYEALDDVVKARCADISLYDWQRLRWDCPAGKHIGTTSDGKPGYIDDPALSKEELLRQEISDLKTYLRETDYQAIKCGELGLSMAEEYPDSHAKRTQARARINEIEGILSITPQVIAYPS